MRYSLFMVPFLVLRFLGYVTAHCPACDHSLVFCCSCVRLCHVHMYRHLSLLSPSFRLPHTVCRFILSSLFQELSESELYI